MVPSLFCLGLTGPHCHRWIYGNESFQVAQYESLVASNSSAFRILEELSTLAQFAQKENAPGNDVFDLLDAVSEKQRQLEAASAFDAQLQKIESVYLRECSIEG